MNKYLKVVLPVILVVVILAACTSPATEPKRAYDEGKIDNKFVGGMTSFAFDMFRELNREEKGENIFISPLSIVAALTMTYNGSGGETREEMKSVLGYEIFSDETANDSFENLLPYLMQADEKTIIDISNSIWYREGEAIGENFLELNKRVFDASIESIDFQKPDSADIINRWIEDATKGKITKMIEPPISPDVVMYLINAVYFKGEWTNAFDEKRTYETKFTEESGTQKTVEMMSNKTTVDFGETKDFKIARLPYGNEKLSMYFVLPEGGQTVDDLIESLDADRWEKMKESIWETENIILGIPKFKMDYGIKKLNDTLISMGMKKAFGAEADFSGIRDDIFISRVLHKAVIEVNEKGSEAAAVTVVEILESAAVEDPAMFVADRPFVFMIADDVHGDILFMGKYVVVE
ncbi:MAG: serpin family protein [Peptostreptococcaceae bacterium]|nr:serpin family protein [Peptostreptococcaceae bacterium]